jgi:hypothetical protein
VYDVDLIDLVGVNVGFRGRNPYSDHAGSSTRYFKMYERDYAYDFVAKAGYNGLLWLLVLAGERDVRRPMGRLSPGEHLAAWLQAKKMGVLDANDRVPSAAVKAAAVEQGIAEWSDMTERELPVGDGETKTVPDALPAVQYKRIADVFEDAYGFDPNRESRWSVEEFQFEELQKAVSVDELTDENSPEVFAEVFLRRTESAEEAMKDKYDYPRTPVDKVFQAYVYWCKEINGVDHVGQYSSGKKRIAEALGVDRMSTSYGDSRVQCYKNTNFTGAGYTLDAEVPDGFDW